MRSNGPSIFSVGIIISVTGSEIFFRYSRFLKSTIFAVIIKPTNKLETNDNNNLSSRGIDTAEERKDELF